MIVDQTCKLSLGRHANLVGMERDKGKLNHHLTPGPPYRLYVGTFVDLQESRLTVQKLLICTDMTGLNSKSI
jgi:hypothetical protein